jgi:hypothetical protein
MDQLPRVLRLSELESSFGQTGEESRPVPAKRLRDI